MKREASAWEQVMLNQKCIMHTLVQISDLTSFQQHLNKFQSFYYSYDEQNKQLVLNDSIQYVVNHSDLQFNDFVAQFSQQDFRPLSSLTVLPSGLLFSIAHAIGDGTLVRQIVNSFISNEVVIQNSGLCVSPSFVFQDEIKSRPFILPAEVKLLFTPKPFNDHFLKNKQFKSNLNYKSNLNERFNLFTSLIFNQISGSTQNYVGVGNCINVRPFTDCKYSLLNFYSTFSLNCQVNNTTIIQNVLAELKTQIQNKIIDRDLFMQYKADLEKRTDHLFDGKWIRIEISNMGEFKEDIEFQLSIKSAIELISINIYTYKNQIKGNLQYKDQILTENEATFVQKSFETLFALDKDFEQLNIEEVVKIMNE
ncbi:Conserved_hypothetical protein [Hexamita inflata]|uniref:Uncharacterized protein n=1 Tax=Hexamita inflata TaxID=28002 RepID=A0AA86QYE7_9EUKA|nr:Conserved hypothetical protein [Hexamita inflata]